MASQSKLQDSSLTQQQLQAEPAIAFDPLNTDHLNKRAEEALLRAAESDVQGRHTYPGAMAARLADQLQRIRRNELINQGVARPVMADYHPDPCRITSMDELRLHNSIERRQREQVANHKAILSRLSHGDLLRMIQKRREGRPLQQVQPEKKNHEPQSLERVVGDQAVNNITLNDEPQHRHLHDTHKELDRPRNYAQIAYENHMTMRHEHENYGLETYQYFMMSQALQNQCSQAREYEGNIADLEQQVKHLKLQNESLSKDKADLAAKCFKLDEQKANMKAEYERIIEEKDKYINILKFQHSSALGTPSENGDILFEYSSPVAANSDAGDNEVNSFSESGDSSFEIVNRAPPNSEAGDNYSTVTNAADSDKEEAADDEGVQEESVRCTIS